MAVWTLTYAGVTKTFKEWGLKGLRRSQVSQAVGGVTFTQSGAAFDGTPLLAIDSLVTISKDGTPWHVGPVIMVPRSGGAKAERLEYQIADPWWYLEKLQFHQFIAMGLAGTPTATTRISLFASAVAGSTVKSTAELMITEAINMAYGAGAPIQVSFVGEFGISPPIQDMRDPTCAEVIRQCLRWAPDVTCGFDYSTTKDGDVCPTLILATRAGATARTIDLADKQSVNLIDITPRDDLRLEVVQLFYQITSTDDGETYTSFAIDTHGTGSPFRTLKATIPLSGPQVQRQSQVLVTEDVSESNVSWWQRHVPLLGEVSDLEISESSLAPADDSGDSFGLAIVSGSVPAWLDNSDSPASGQMTAKALSTYTRTKEDGSEVDFTDDPVSINLSCTNLPSGTYTRVTSYTAGEPVPSGVALALWTAFSVLQYDGSVKINQRECSFIARPGDVLNLSNGMTAWATARMQVQKVDEDIDSGRTTIVFGPPKHLSPQDLIEMIRTLRGKPPVYNLDERATGIKDDGAEAKGGTATANDNSGAAGTNWHRMKVKNPDGEETMTLDAAEGVKLEGADGSIDHQTANNRTVYQADAGESASVEPDKIEVLDAEGAGVTIQASEITLLDGSGNGITLTAEGITITRDGQSTTLSIDQLLFDDGEGNTNSITNEQMVISAEGETAIYAVNEVSYNSGAETASLSTADGLQLGNDGNTLHATATELEIVNGSDTATVSPSGLLIYNGADISGSYDATHVSYHRDSDSASFSIDGLHMDAYSTTVDLTPPDGLALGDDSGPNVTIQPLAGQNITLQYADLKGVDDDEFLAYFLRGDRE